AFSEVPRAEITVKDAELKLATQLIEQIATDEFHPEKYEDDVKKRVQDLIQKKVDGQEITSAPAEAPRGQIIDLMEALKQSLASKPAEGARKPPKAAAGARGGKRAKSKE